MEQEHSPARLLKQINDGLRKNANNDLRSKNMTFSQLGVLIFLDLAPGKSLSLKSLERKMHIAQSTTFGLVTRMEKKCMVEVLQDPADQRIRIVHLLPAGEAALASSHSNMKKDEQTILSNLSPDEQETLIYLLNKIRDSVCGTETVS